MEHINYCQTDHLTEVKTIKKYISLGLQKGGRDHLILVIFAVTEGNDFGTLRDDCLIEVQI